MVDAALQSLIEDGYGATTARSIAARAGSNPALVFYHFGGVDELLLAALEKSSTERLDVYRQALNDSSTTEKLATRAGELFRESIRDGHVTAVTEMIGASLTKPELRSAVVHQMEPWLDLAQEAIGRFLRESPFSALGPAAEPAAFAVVSGYLGLNMMSRLMTDQSQTDALFQLLAQLARLVPRIASP